MATERFYEKVEFRRFLAEPGMQLASSEVRGAWFWTLCHMWGEGVYEFTWTVADWAVSWNCSQRRAAIIIAGLGEKDGRKGIANVTCHGDVTLCHSRVTVHSRFLARRDKERRQASLRQQRHRANAPVTEPVTPHVTPHSNSNSNSNSKEEKIASPPMDMSPAPGAAAGMAWHKDYPELDVMWADASGAISPHPVFQTKMCEALNGGVTLEEAKVVFAKVRADIEAWDLRKALFAYHYKVKRARKAEAATVAAAEKRKARAAAREPITPEQKAEWLEQRRNLGKAVAARTDTADRGEA